MMFFDESCAVCATYPLTRRGSSHSVIRGGDSKSSGSGKCAGDERRVEASSVAWRVPLARGAGLTMGRGRWFADADRVGAPHGGPQ